MSELSEGFAAAEVATIDSGSRHLAWIDRIGALLAGLCAIHCFVFMLGTIALGFSASNVFFNPGLRWLMVVLAAVLSVASIFVHGKHHGHGPAWLMVGGLAAIIIGNMWGIWATAGETLCLCGGLILATGHLIYLFKSKPNPSPVNPIQQYLPRSLGVLLLLVACVMAMIQHPSVAKILPYLGQGPAKTQGEKVGWGMLAQLDIESGDIGPDLRKIVGEQIMVPGFVVPLDESGKSFLLAPYAGACIHGPTPPMNQIIFVTMKENAKPIDPWMWDPIWVTGKLEILEIHSPFGSAGFRMEGFSTEVYR